MTKLVIVWCPCLPWLLHTKSDFDRKLSEYTVHNSFLHMVCIVTICSLFMLLRTCV